MEKWGSGGNDDHGSFFFFFFFFPVFQKCKKDAKIYSREQSRRYKNKYPRRPYVKFTQEDKELLLKFK